MNGNKAFSLISGLLLLVFCTSCSLFQPVTQEPRSSRDQDQNELPAIQGRRVWDPETQTYVYIESAPTEPLDTIRWTDVPESDYPPITSSGGAPPPTRPGAGQPTTQQPVGTGEFGSQLLSSYNVTMLLPFLTDRFDTSGRSIPDNSIWALHFFSGARMALDEFEAQAGARLNVAVLDSRADETRVRDLLRTNNALRSANMIIGPYLRNNVSLMADQARQSGQVLVSPYSAASNISDDNPNYIQVNPTLESHLSYMVQHALQTHRPDQVVLVAKNDAQEKGRFPLIQQEYRRFTGMSTPAPPVRELVLDDPAYDITPYLSPGTTVFMLPIWADRDFIMNFLQNLARVRNDVDNVIVYGMPQWLYFDRIDISLFQRLNVHLTSNVYIDPLQPAAKTFRTSFFNRFNALPRDEAYIGYDITRYFVSMLRQYGTRFQYQLERHPENLLHTQFRFERVVDTAPVTPGAPGEMPGGVERWENKYLNVLQYRNGRLQKVN